jgi:iron complex outermembrane receptor protein
MASNGLDPGAHIIYLGNRNFDPEFSLETDLGASARFSNFSAELSLFNNHIQHYIYLTMLADNNGNPVTDAQGNKTYQYQQAAAQLYGMEAGFSLHPVKLRGFSFDNNLSVVYGFNKSEIYEGITPKVEIEWAAKQNRFLGLNHTETPTPGYALLHIGVTADIRYYKSRPMILYIQVMNLLDKVYQSNLSRLKYFEYYNQSPNGYSGMYNMGRNICVKLVLPF